MIARLHDRYEGRLADLEFDSALPRKGDVLHVGETMETSVAYEVLWIAWADRGDRSMVPHIHTHRLGVGRRDTPSEA